MNNERATVHLWSNGGNTYVRRKGEREKMSSQTARLGKYVQQYVRNYSAGWTLVIVGGPAVAESEEVLEHVDGVQRLL